VSTTPDHAEVEALHARIADLEAQLAEQTRVTNELVARSQEKLYWLERWHIDLERVMSRRSAQLALQALKPIRESFRALRKLKRRATGRS
jgi:hypothetical protein